MLVAVAAGFDLHSRRIPNPLIVVGLILGLTSQGMRAGDAGLLQGLLAAGAVLLLLILPFAQKMLGGGDVKLAMLIGTWTGTLAALDILIYGALFTGMISALFWLKHHFRPSVDIPRIPIAVPLGASTLLYTALLLPPLLVSNNS